MTTRIARLCWLLPVLTQHAMVGSVTALIVVESWPGVFAAAWLLCALWWVNMGQRIDRHQDGALTAVLYCTTAAIGVTVGAWWWR